MMLPFLRKRRHRHSSPSKICFVCGCPRSGTTSLAQIINCHPDAVIGIERFKKRLHTNRGRDFTPALFERERFLSLDPDDTNTGRQNTAILQKAAQIWPPAMIGDKIPRLYTRQRQLRKTFPEARLVAIVRNPLDVALSWQVRADKPTDKWPSENDRNAAVVEWEQSLEHIAAARQTWGDDLTIVSYDTFFRQADKNSFEALIAKLYRTLGLRAGKGEAKPAANALFRNLAGQTERPVPPELEEALERARGNERLGPLLASALSHDDAEAAG